MRLLAQAGEDSIDSVKNGVNLVKSLTSQAYVDASNLVASTDYERSVYLRQRASDVKSSIMGAVSVNVSKASKTVLQAQLNKLVNQIADLQAYGLNLADIGSINQEGPCFWIGILRARRDAVKRALSGQPPLTAGQKAALAKQMLAKDTFGMAECDKIALCGYVYELTGKMPCPFPELDFSEVALDVLVEAVRDIHDDPSDPNAGQILRGFKDAFNAWVCTEPQAPQEKPSPSVQGMRGLTMASPFGISFKLAMARFGGVAKKPARLAAGDAPPVVNSVPQIMTLISQKPFYDAFVQFVIDTAPSYIGSEWKNAFQVNEALLSFEWNYSSKQNARAAAAWGIQAPSTIRADIAFGRMKLAEQQYNDMFLGRFKPENNTADSAGFPNGPSGEFDVNDPSAQTAVANQGPSASIFLNGDQFTSIQTLLGPSDTLSLWYSHVWRSLATFIPALALLLGNSGSPQSNIYKQFVIPNMSNSPAFVLWVIVGNTHQFFEMGANGDLLLRELLTNDVLNDVKLGIEDAQRQLASESYFLALLGKQIQVNIDFLEMIQRILKVLTMPVKVLQALIENLPKLGGWSFWTWGALGAAALVLVGGTVYVLRR